MSNEAFEKFISGYGFALLVKETWQAAKADSESILSEQQNTIAELQAHINVLRENLDYAYYEVNTYFAKNIKDLLASTPAQSLQEHDNEVIEKCAKVCEDINEDGYTTIEEQFCAERIRDLKGLIK